MALDKVNLSAVSTLEQDYQFSSSSSSSSTDNDEGSSSKENTITASPAIESDGLTLELMRLRLLASRKRKPNSPEIREEGEISDAETSTSRTSHTPMTNIEMGSPVLRPSSLRQGSRSGASHHLRLIKNSSLEGFSRADRLFLTLQRDLRPISSSFDPQQCTVTIDSEEEDHIGNEHAHPIPTLSTQMMSSVETDEPPKALELRRIELERQTELLNNTRSQHLIMLEETKTLREQLEASEKVTKAAVETQQRLKAQLRETKEIINRGKQLKINNLARQRLLEKEISKKRKLVNLLEQSITAKRTMINAPEASSSEPQLALEPSEGPLIPSQLTLEPSKESRLSSNLSLEPSEGTSIRSQELAELEKKAQKVQEELIAAQKFLQNSQQKRSKKKVIKAKGSTNKGTSIQALGKIMSIHPLLLPKPVDELKAIDDETLQKKEKNWTKYFPSRFWTLGGSLFASYRIREIIFNVNFLLQKLCSSYSIDFRQTVTSAPSSLSNTVDEAGVFETQMLRPYRSPLRMFSSYRFSPNFSHVAPEQGILSKTFTNNINPQRILCFYEFSSPKGCRRVGCEAQHFKTIFLDDASVLENFLLDLLTMPVAKPYKDQIELVNDIKTRLLKQSKSTLPLIALVGVILDAHRRMYSPSDNVVFLVPRESIRLEKVDIFKEDEDKFKALPKSLLQGPTEWWNNRILNVSRYFPENVSESPEETDLYLDPLLKKIHTSICQGLPLEGIRQLLDEQTEEPSIVCKEILNDLGIIQSPLSTLGWIRELYKHAFDFQKLMVFFVEGIQKLDSLLPDFFFATVKCACDLNEVKFALDLLYWLAFKRTWSTDVRLEEIFASLDHSTIEIDVRVRSALLFFYIKGESTYPASFFCSFPFDYIYREDFMFHLPVEMRPLVKAHTNILSLLSKDIQTKELQSWLDQALNEATAEQNHTKSITSRSIDHGDLEVDHIISSPLNLVLFTCDLVSKTSSDDASLPNHFSKILRLFWQKTFGAELNDFDICSSVASFLSLPEILIDLSVNIVQPIGDLDRNDPFLWICSGMTFAALYDQKSPHLIFIVLETSLSFLRSGFDYTFLSMLLHLFCSDSGETDKFSFAMKRVIAEGGPRRPTTHLEKIWHHLLTSEGIPQQYGEEQGFFMLSIPPVCLTLYFLAIQLMFRLLKLGILLLKYFRHFA